MSDVIQTGYSIPPHAQAEPGLLDHYRAGAKQKFADTLLDWLTENHGGVVSPIHIQEEDRFDFMFATGTTKVITMYAHVSTLPPPPAFKLLGGPADGRIVLTNGDAYWRVPMAPPLPSVANYGEPPVAERPRYAEYRKVEGTQAYEFVRVTQ